MSCSHYDRKCAIIAPCCNKTFICHVCHDNEECHPIDRFKIMHIVCQQCSKKQEINNVCTGCGVTFGKYFCAMCRLFDDNDRQQFHCDGCGLCRVGGRKNFFHCSKCDLCLGLALKDSHKCVEKSSRSNCPVCMEDLHTSRTENRVPQCGHVIHRKCFQDLLKTGNTSCPLCNESMIELTETWKHIDEEIANTPMPEEYRNSHVEILCRDCHKTSDVKFHIVGLKCSHCGSYNTCQQGGVVDITCTNESENQQ